MYLIIFTGAPATGKSSIAKAISREFKMPYYSKDDFKISLYEQYGFNNHDEKKQLSILSEKKLTDQICKAIINNDNIIVDNNFKHFEEIKSIIHLNNQVKIMCFHLVAKPNILAERYNSRNSSGHRHRALYTLNVYPIVEGLSVFHKKIDETDVVRMQKNIVEETFGDFIFEINTDNIDTEFDAIVATIRNKIEQYMEEYK